MTNRMWDIAKDIAIGLAIILIIFAGVLIFWNKDSFPVLDVKVKTSTVQNNSVVAGVTLNDVIKKLNGGGGSLDWKDIINKPYEILNLRLILDDKADSVHEHDNKYSLLTHNHDTRYAKLDATYTKSESDAQMVLKLDKGGGEMAGELMLDTKLKFKSGNFFTSIETQAQTADEMYFLPKARPTSSEGMTLHCNMSGYMTWEKTEPVITGNNDSSYYYSGKKQFEKLPTPVSVDAEARQVIATMLNIGSFDKSKAYHCQSYMMGNMLVATDYGLKNDGTTDNTKALNDLIILAGSTKIIYFPYGDYAITGTVNIPSDVKFAGEYFHEKLMSSLFFKGTSANITNTKGSVITIYCSNINLKSDGIATHIKNPTITNFNMEMCWVSNPFGLVCNELSATECVFDTAIDVQSLHLDEVTSKRKIKCSGRAVITDSQLYDQSGTGALFFYGSNTTEMNKSQLFLASFVGGLMSDTETITIKAWACVGNLAVNKITVTPAAGYQHEPQWNPPLY